MGDSLTKIQSRNGVSPGIQVLLGGFLPDPEVKGQGLGVGLTLARALLENLGGSVQVLDAPQGCLVEMLLPVEAPGDR